MQKKNLILIFLIILSLTSFVSAYNGGRFTFSEVLNLIDASSMFLMVIFIVMFAFLFFSLSKFFRAREGRQNTAIAAVVALSLSGLITYWINKSNFNIEQGFYNFSYNIGISQTTLNVLIGLVISAFVIFLLIKLKKNALFIIGGLLIILSFFIYEKTVVLVIGIGLILLRLLIGIRRRGRVYQPYNSYPYSPSYPSSRRARRRGWQKREYRGENPRKLYKQLKKEKRYQERLEESSRSKRELYKEELGQRRQREKERQALIKARARNIAIIRKERLRRESKRQKRYNKIKKRKGEGGEYGFPRPPEG